MFQRIAFPAYYKGIKTRKEEKNMRNSQFIQNFTSDDGVVYYYQGINKLVNDIEIPDTVTEFRFRHFPGRNKTSYLLANIKRQFPQVHTLIIEDKVSLIELRNSMFPNVRIVHAPNNKSFADNVPCLIHNGILKNVFCLGTDGVLDGSAIRAIANYALEGCRSTQLTNFTQPNLGLHSMDGLIDDMPFSKDHTKLMGGSVLLDIEPGMDIRLPEDTFKIAPPCKILSAKSYIVPNVQAFVSALCSSVALCGMRDATLKDSMFPFYFPKQALQHFVKPVTFSRLFDILHPSHIEMEENEFYCVDGDAVYTKDKKIIVSVLPSVTEFSIPDTVKTIARFAFQNCKQLTSITIPDSVRWIEDEAFSSGSLTSLTFESTHYVHMDCHSFALSRLQELYLPGGLNDVPQFASTLGVKKLVLGEGIVNLTEISTSGILELYLPASLQYLKKCSFSSVKTVYLAGPSFPHGLFSSLAMNTANTGLSPLEDTLVRLVVWQPDGSQYTYYVPRAIYYGNAKEFDEMFVFGLPALLRETNGLTGLFQFCQSTQQIQDTAIQLSFLGVDKEASAFVKNIGSAIVKRFIKTGYSEANFLTLVRTGLLSKKALQTVCDYAQENQYTSLLAYALQQLQHPVAQKRNALAL